MYSYQVAATAVCFIASPPTLYVGLDSGVLWSYKVSNNYADFSPISQIPLHTARIMHFAHAVKQRLLLSISRDKHLAVVDLDTNKVRSSIAVGHPGITAAQSGLASIIYDDEDEKVFIGTFNNVIYIYTLPPNSQPLLLHALHGHTAPVTALYYHSRDHYLFSGSHDYRVGVWAIQPGKSTVEASRSHLNGMMALGPSKQIKAVVYCPALKEVVTGVDSGWLCVWNTETGRIRYAWKGHGDGVSGLWWKNSEKVLVSSGLDGKVKFWDMRATQLSPDKDTKPAATQSTSDGEQQQHTETSEQFVSSSSSSQSEQTDTSSTQSAAESTIAPSTSIDQLSSSSTTTTVEPLPTETNAALAVANTAAQVVDEPEPVIISTQSAVAVHSAIDEAEQATDEPSLF